MIYLDLLIGFLKVGLFAFGGAYGAIPLIRDVVLSYGWLDDEMLTYMIAVSESTPGPIMVNLATYVGNSQAGFPGALIATMAVVMPSFIIILLIMVLLKKLLKSPYVQAVLQGMKPCIIGIILATGLYMILHNCLGSFTNPALNTSVIILTAVLSGVYFAVIIAVIIVLAMNLVGSLLISALVIFPALSAMRVFKSFHSVMVCSAVLSIFCSLLGILISILAGTPVGSTIVAVDIVLFFVFSAFGTIIGGVHA